MPPPIPRQALSGLSGPLTSRTASSSTATSKIISASSTLRLSRSNSTSTLPPAQIRVPPESPKFITVPEPPQNAEIKLGPVRGRLPIPREIFTRRAGGTRKGQSPAQYVKEIQPLSAAEKAGLPPKSRAEALRRAEAARRRQTLAEGLEGLYKRKTSYERKRTVHSQENARRNQEAAAAPERPDEVYTRATVRADTVSTAVPLDPLRFERAEEARARTAGIAALKSEGRRDALAQLYMAAADFIVDEKELEGRVEKLFDAEYFRNMGQATGHPENMWDVHNKPAGVADLVAMMDGSYFGLVEGKRHGNAVQATQRQKVVSEELTGGKLDID